MTIHTWNYHCGQLDVSTQVKTDLPVHVVVKLICLTICLWIFLSTDNVLTLLHYDTWGGQSAALPGWRWNLRNVNCSCLGSMLLGEVYHKCSSVKLTFPHICLWYLYIYISTSKLICIPIHLWIFLSTDNVLTLLHYDTWGGQSAVLPGWSWNLRNVNCSCCGSVLLGGIS